YRWKGFQARIVQHETDHLNGRCFVDQASPAAQLEARAALDEMRAFYEREYERGFEPTPEEFAASVARWEAERA
ncbi:MAG: peptide deformylase, partial [Thermoguttaceae bacterium]|nr:peptide deformylase [Thermoguttaceae bacterium]